MILSIVNRFCLRRLSRFACAGLCLVEFGVVEASPSVEFTHIPAYGSTENLTGCVSNVNVTGYGVAVYVYVGGWWTKPTFVQPLSTIRSDCTWTCDITTGGSDAYATQLAAYLVPLTYAPPLAEGWPQLPDVLASNAVASLRVTRPFTRRLWFSGYEWSVKDSQGMRTGPGDNFFSDSVSNVWTDALGRLHLKICKRAGIWSCSEIVSVRSFGSGTYRTFLETPGDALDSHTVLGLFTWNDDAPYTHREIDIELSRWDNPSDTNNAQFVVQPWDVTGHLTRYRIPSSVTNATYSFTWLSNRIDFASHAGFFAPAPATNTALAEWTFKGQGVPQPGGENFRLNLWLCNTAGTSDDAEEEVVVRRFAFLPSPMPQPVWTNVVWTAGVSFSLTAAVEPQVAYQVQASSNLLSWITCITQVPTNGTLVFSEAATTSRQFYRLSVPNQ